MSLTENIDFKIEYKPTFAGRIASVLLPVMKRIFPKKVYINIYDFLYASYKKSIKFVYFLKLLFSYLSTNKFSRLKSSLTYKLLDYTMGGPKAIENAFDIVLKVEKEKLSGDIIECGVARGGTAAMMALTNINTGEKIRNFWFFDSYEGLPVPTEDDYINGKTGEHIRPLPKGSCLGTIDEVKELFFEILELPKDKINLVKGWFQDTVPATKDKIDKIAVLRLDGDWYESTLIPLQNFYEKIVPGGLIIIDDYATCYGSRKATDEFRKNQSIQTPLNQDGRGGVWFEKPKE